MSRLIPGHAARGGVTTRREEGPHAPQTLDVVAEDGVRLSLVEYAPKVRRAAPILLTHGTFSNGNVALLTNMAKRAGLPWDLVLSAELVRHYKPDPETYLMAPNFLDLLPEEVMLCAAHPNDLRAAQIHGLRTAYVLRPLEWGPEGEAEEPDPSFDIIASDFVELAEKLES